MLNRRRLGHSPFKREWPTEGCLEGDKYHAKVVHFIRRFYPSALLVAGLGELQDTPKKRFESYHKGYVGGCPDIILLNHHKKFDGMAIEFKTPKGTGKLSDKQEQFLKRLKLNNYKTIVSCDYDEIVMEIVKFMADTRLVCGCCGRHFKTDDSLANHLKHFHRM